MLPDTPSPLELLDQEIFSCTKCVSTVTGIAHPQNPLSRGNPAKVMVVGIAPGNKELTAGQAFVGQAGKKLMSWLISGGIGRNEAEVRSRVYLTALVKCAWKKKGAVSGTAISNCSQFLAKQIQLVSPELLITLGAEPLRSIFKVSGPQDGYVGKIFTEEDLVGPKLFYLLPNGCRILPLPHSSGLSRWVNNHKPLLKQSLEILKAYSPTLFPEVTDES